MKKIPGYRSVKVFAETTGLPYETVKWHMLQGYCAWPRKTNSDNLSRHPLYKTWESMIQRCHNKTSHNYIYYGARGISVCPEWRESRVFLTYCDTVLGIRPKGCSIDRIDNNKGYAPNNIRWATHSQQQLNKRARKKA